MEEILKQLTNSANIRLSSLNIEYSSVARNTFDNLLENASKRMVREKRTSKQDIDLAKSNFDKLIIESALGKERQIVSDRDLIRFTALNNSQKGLCPLWPIC